MKLATEHQERLAVNVQLNHIAVLLQVRNALVRLSKAGARQCTNNYETLREQSRLHRDREHVIGSSAEFQGSREARVPQHRELPRPE